MDFDANSENITTLLVASLAVVAIVLLLRKKYDSNIPLFFYAVALIFTNATEKAVNPYLMLTGLAFALLLRFEFMSPGFTKFMAYLATGAMGVIVYVFLVEVFGSGQAPF